MTVGGPQSHILCNELKDVYAPSEVFNSKITNLAITLLETVEIRKYSIWDLPTIVASVYPTLF